MSQGGRYVVGLIGSGIGSSLSPPLHEREADELGLRYVYQLLDTDRLGLRPDDVGELVRQAGRLGFAGLNITHPCKQAVVKHLDDLSPEAAELGAVNTVVFANGRAVGHNTDGYGFARGFVRGLPDARLREVVLLGAGGAGAAVAHAVLRLGAVRVAVVDPDRDRAEALAAALGAGPTPVDGDDSGGRASAGRVVVETAERLPDRLRTADGLVNASPVGMTPHGGTPVDPGLLRPDIWVADVIYRPLETELLRHARELGCRTLDGGGMVVYQAAEAMRLFTGRTPDVERMLRHFAELTRTDLTGSG
jgi:shikimate dehydrogenase